MLNVILKGIVGFFLFIAGGLAVIIVGFFMLRGTMSMWDRPYGKVADAVDDDIDSDNDCNNPDNKGQDKL